MCPTYSDMQHCCVHSIAIHVTSADSIKAQHGLGKAQAQSSLIDWNLTTSVTTALHTDTGICLSKLHSIGIKSSRHKIFKEEESQQ